MFCDFIQFKEECQSNVEKQGADLELKQKAIEFMAFTAAYKYTYNFKWMGMPIIQLPQDIVAMQEIIWDVKPDLIIETGIARGGSVVFFSSLLKLIGDGKVLGIDIDIRQHNRLAIENHPMYERIKLIEGSSTSDAVIKQVMQYIEDNEFQKILVVLDSNHTHEHVLNELNTYSKFVMKDSYLVVFDTSIEDSGVEFPDRSWGKGNNPKTAVNEFLKNNSRFIIDKFIENKLLLTTAPSGYLKCISNLAPKNINKKQVFIPKA